MKRMPSYTVPIICVVLLPSDWQHVSANIYQSQAFITGFSDSSIWKVGYLEAWDLAGKSRFTMTVLIQHYLPGECNFHYLVLIRLLRN